jgi:hypothetical protein
MNAPYNGQGPAHFAACAISTMVAQRNVPDPFGVKLAAVQPV